MSLALWSWLLVAQPSSCAPLDASKPAQFLSFERIGEGESPAGESRQRVWLRLTNNSSCVLRLPRGRGPACDPTTANPTAGPLDNRACVRLAYDLFDGTSTAPQPWTVTDRTWQPIADGADATIAPGAAILFTVPQFHFIDQKLIGVTVADLDKSGDGPYRGQQRYVMFGRGDLPMDVREKLRRD